VNFTGNVTTNQKELILDQVVPQQTGDWEHFTIDLKMLFNNSKTGASNAYYIRSIRFVAAANNKQGATIYIDNITVYQYRNMVPRFNRSELKKVLEELQEVCKLSGYVAYTSPAMERRDDRLVVIPSGASTSDLRIVENKNLLNVSGVEYKPLDWGLCNYAIRTYTLTEKIPKPAKSDKTKAKRKKKQVKTKTKKKKQQYKTVKHEGKVTKEEADSYIWYGPLTSIEQANDVKSKAEAAELADKYVESHAFHSIAFTAKILGTALLDPAHLINVSIPSKQIFGAFEVKAINYELNTVSGEYTSQITFGQLYRPYMHFIRNSMKSRGTLRNIYNDSIYNNYGMKETSQNTGLNHK
jgi:ElaB/YqjD/DUF883 family membrane-anchored ribosome-binding protein